MNVMLRWGLFLIGVVVVWLLLDWSSSFFTGDRFWLSIAAMPTVGILSGLGLCKLFMFATTGRWREE